MLNPARRGPFQSRDVQKNSEIYFPSILEDTPLPGTKISGPQKGLPVNITGGNAKGGFRFNIACSVGNAQVSNDSVDYLQVVEIVEKGMPLAMAPEKGM